MVDATCFACHAEDATMLEEDGTPVCERCHDRRAEEAHERFVAAFFGTDAPFTVDEQSHRSDGSR